LLIFLSFSGGGAGEEDGQENEGWRFQSRKKAKVEEFSDGLPLSRGFFSVPLLL
jgi:hypothetical protein